MIRRAVIIAFNVLVLWMAVHEFNAYDSIHYYADQPKRLFDVVAIASVGGAFVWGFSCLPISFRRELGLIWNYAVALVFAYVVAWTSAFIYVCHGVGQSIRWDSGWLGGFLATPNGSKLLNHALIYSVFVFIPLAAMAVFLVKRLGREKTLA
jgi:hypothetical protein